MMILGLHHAQITMPPGAEAEARHFYCGLLALAEIEKPAALRGRGGFWLQVGGQEVHVSVEAPGVERSATKAHLAYLVDNLSALEQTLAAAGVDLQHDVPLAGYVRVHCRDPFGNRVEFMAQR